MNLVIAKAHKHGKFYEAVVMDTDAKNLIVYRSGLGFNRAGKAACRKWLDGAAPAYLEAV